MTDDGRKTSTEQTTGRYVGWFVAGEETCQKLFGLTLYHHSLFLSWTCVGATFGIAVDFEIITVGLISGDHQ